MELDIIQSGNMDTVSQEKNMHNSYPLTEDVNLFCGGLNVDGWTDFSMTFVNNGGFGYRSG